MSYYVTITDTHGREKTQWGIDLARAMAESPVQVGERIFLEDMGMQEVTVKDPVKDELGNVIGHVPLVVERVEWNVYDKDPGLSVAQSDPTAEPIAGNDIDSDAAALVDAVSRGVEARDATLAEAQLAEAAPRRRASDMVEGGGGMVAGTSGRRQCRPHGG